MGLLRDQFVKIEVEKSTMGVVLLNLIETELRVAKQLLEKRAGTYCPRTGRDSPPQGAISFGSSPVVL